ncbi:MAG: ABC transporter ATP-binding protein [Clostridia bacterium]|nr:ABC transporter ATP-binding protein [Clostridia bacterium]
MLTLQNVTKRYLRRTALDDVSLNLEAGKTCLLLGPTGSGKTTMMKLIAGLTRPTSGSIALEGQPIGHATKAQVAYMPTENYFYSYMTVADAGKYYADFFPDFDPAHFRRLLTQLELSGEDRIRQLSSGMAAKLRLALALARDAALSMFDEPLNGVDILTRTQTIDAIVSNRQAGRTMIISTHLVDELEDVVDTVVLLRQGHLIHAGDKQEVCAGSTLKDLYIQVYGHAGETQTKEVERDA